MSLTNELQEAINKNLPSMVGEELVKRLKKADEDEKDLAGVRRANTELLRQINEVRADLAQAEQALAKHPPLAQREAAVAEAERSLENKMLKHQLEVSDGNVKFARDVAMGLVRNTEFKRDVFTSHKNRAIPVTQGGTVMQSYNTETGTVSTSEEAK